MNKKTVFILQGNKEDNEALRKNFLADNYFEVVGVTTDGITGLAMIADKKPNFVLMELALAGYDGISVIRKIKELKLESKIIVVSAMRRDEIIRKVEEVGADYFIAKPCEFAVLKDRMIEMENERDPRLTKEQYLERMISKILLNIGITSKIKGFTYIKEAVKLVVEDPENINSITKRLYPQVADKFKASVSKVERAIRHAITAIYQRGRINVINHELGVNVFVENRRPTNGDFIAVIADKLFLENEAFRA